MNAKLKKRKAARAGRPRKQGVERYPGGQIVHRHRAPVETQEQVLATVTSQPHRKGASDSRSRLLGYSLGRLFISGTISRDQHSAGEWFAQLWLAYHRRITGITLPKVSAHLQEFIAGGDAPLSHANDDNDPDQDNQLRRRWAAVEGALCDAGRHHAGHSLMFAVCVIDRDPHRDQIGVLRELLNIVDRVRQKGA